MYYAIIMEQSIGQIIRETASTEKKVETMLTNIGKACVHKDWPLAFYPTLKLPDLTISPNWHPNLPGRHPTP